MAAQTAPVAAICECIDHCFAFTMWCDDFARYVDPEDMINGQERAFEVVSDATRLHSFVALRKLDEFLRFKKAKEDDLIAKDLNIDAETVLSEVAGKFLTAQERENINKGAAHLTERLTLDPDTEVDLHKILRRSLPVFSQLISEHRKINKDQDNVPFLDRTEALVQGEIAIETQRLKELLIGADLAPANYRSQFLGQLT